jgi:putative ABC transport system substrate-binding protein
MMKVSCRSLPFVFSALVLFTSIVCASPPPHKIGNLSPSTKKETGMRLDALRRGLASLEYIEGKYYVPVQLHVEGNRERLAALATEVLGQGVVVIITSGSSATLAAACAAKGSGRTVPVVFALAADPVSNGLVEILSRPGGNVTRLSNSRSVLIAKRLEILKEALPALRRVAVMWSPKERNGPPQIDTLRHTATGLGVEIFPVPFQRAQHLVDVFAEIRVRGMDVVYVFVLANRNRNRNRNRKPIAAEHGLGLPTIFASPVYFLDGELFSYGVDSQGLYRRAASYFTINLKTARDSEISALAPMLLRANGGVE